MYFVLIWRQYKMTQYNTIDIKSSNLQLNKFKWGIKSGAEVTLNLSSNVIGDSNDETIVSHKLLLTNREVSGICKIFPNNSSANIKLSKTQLSKMVQFGGFLGRL